MESKDDRQQNATTAAKRSTLYAKLTAVQPTIAAAAAAAAAASPQDTASMTANYKLTAARAPNSVLIGFNSTPPTGWKEEPLRYLINTCAAWRSDGIVHCNIWFMWMGLDGRSSCLAFNTTTRNATRSFASRGGPRGRSAAKYEFLAVPLGEGPEKDALALRMLNWCKQHENVPFNWKGFMLNAPCIPSCFARPTRDTDALFCAEEVSCMLKDAGIPGFEDCKPALQTPATIKKTLVDVTKAKPVYIARSCSMYQTRGRDFDERASRDGPIATSFDGSGDQRTIQDFIDDIEGSVGFHEAPFSVDFRGTS